MFVAGYFSGITVPGAFIALVTCVEILARDARVLIYDNRKLCLYQYPVSSSKTDCCYLV